MTNLEGEARLLLRAVVPHATEAARRSPLHGPAHWRRVARNGRMLCDSTPGADPHVVALFAALHDCRREGDGYDPLHGRRAARSAEELRGVVFDAEDEQMEILGYALRLHADGGVSDDPTVGCCWDADRLDLPRCGIEPDPALLSTEAARRLYS